MPGNPVSVRDLVVRESLKNLAEEASERFRELLRSGEEVPYEVLEPGQGSPLATYAPGGWGPPEADRLIESTGRRWRPL